MNMLKDSRLALGLAKSLGVQLPLAQAVNELLTEADAKGWSQQDFAVASNWMRDQREGDGATRRLGDITWWGGAPEPRMILTNPPASHTQSPARAIRAP